jgi:hypothetical protein
MGAKRVLKSAAKTGLRVVRDVAALGGLVVLPRHYYTPIADQRDLRRRGDWRLQMDAAPLPPLAEQEQWLLVAVTPFLEEYRENRHYVAGVQGGYGPGYGYIEAQALHGVVRSLKPKRVLEVGSGVSTYCLHQALILNAAEGSPSSLTVIDPHCPAPVAQIPDIQVIRSAVETTSLDQFLELEAGDLLFIDTTHAVRTGGDVIHLYLKVIPRLKPGVLIHIHDIFLPYLYQQDALETLFEWNETALLAALLLGNERLRVLTCLSALFHWSPHTLQRAFPSFEGARFAYGIRLSELGHFPTSIYLQTS